MDYTVFLKKPARKERFTASCLYPSLLCQQMSAHLAVRDAAAIDELDLRVK